jgi:hypothetical protein
VVVLAFLPQLLAVFDQFEEWVSSDWSYLAIFAVLGDRRVLPARAGPRRW